jgi:hypothetical protein
MKNTETDWTKVQIEKFLASTCRLCTFTFLSNSKRNSLQKKITITIMCSSLFGSLSEPLALAQAMSPPSPKSSQSIRIAHATTHTPVLRPILSEPQSEALPAPKPTSLLHASIQETGALSFGAILLKDNNDFPKNFAGVPFPLPPAPPVVKHTIPLKANVIAAGTPAPGTVLSATVTHQTLNGQVAANQTLLKAQADQDLLKAQADRVETPAQPSLQAQEAQPTVAEQTAAPPQTTPLGSQSTFVYTPGWMSTETTAKTTYNQGTQNWQETQSQWINQQQTQTFTTQTRSTKVSSSTKTKKIHLANFHSITDFFHKGSNLINRAENLVNGAGTHLQLALNKITLPVEKLEIKASNGLNQLDMAVTNRVDKVQQAVATKVTKVRNAIATRVDNTVQKVRNFGYSTTDSTTQQVWHPGTMTEIPGQTYYPPQTVISDVPSQTNFEPIPSPPVNIAPDPVPNNNVDVMPLSVSQPDTSVQASVTPPPPTPVALSAVPVKGTFQTAKVKTVVSRTVSAEVDWDPWYHNLVAAGIANWSSSELQPGKLDLLVTVRADGKVACEPAVQSKLASADGTKLPLPVPAPPAMQASVIRAESAVNALSQKPVTEFPASTKRKSVTFEVELVSTAVNIADYVDTCTPDVEHVTTVTTKVSLLPHEVADDRRIAVQS